MADPWANDPNVPIRSRDAEREALLARYQSSGDPRAANPGAQVLLPGDPGYGGQQGQFREDVGAVIADEPWADAPVVSDADLAAQAKASEMLSGNRAPDALYQGLLFGFADELGGGLAGIGQDVRNAIGQARGVQPEFTGAQLRDAYTDLSRDRVSGFAEERPVSNFALQAGGGLLTGGGAIGQGVRGAALAGAGLGGIYGLGAAEGNLAERAPSAAVGTIAGGVTGAATPVVGNALRPVGSRIAELAGNIPGVRQLGENIRYSSAMRGADPEQRAALRLANIIDPQEAVQQRGALTDLGVAPSVLDIGGGTAERLVRTAAGPAGPGAEMAVANLGARTANLKPEVMAVTRGLSPDQRSAEELAQGLTETRSRLATEQYAPAYAVQVPVTDDLMAALGDEPGRAALRRARQAAVARQDATQVAEIDALLNSDGPLPMDEVSRMARATAQGFTQNAYHGTKQEINGPFDAAWRASRGGERGAYEGSGVSYFTDNPDQASAYAISDRTYPRSLGGDRWVDYGANVFPAKIKMENPFVVDDEPLAMAIKDNPREIEALIEAGYDGLILREVEDGTQGVRGNVMAPFSPDNIRSRFDSFAPSGYRAPPTTVSAGALDRTRIAMSNRAEALSRNASGGRDIAGGLRGRASQIDEVLAAVPELAPARATYRELSGQIDAVSAPLDPLSTDPRDFATWVRNLSPEQREAATVAIRQDILDRLGRQREAGAGTMQTLSQSPYVRQNLEALLGQEAAGQYLGSIQARVQQAQRAARVSPNTNSQTFGRMADEQSFNTANALGAAMDVGQSLTGNGFAIARTIDRLRARAEMSPEERAAIVELGLGPAENLERIFELAERARTGGRPPPREVRAWLDQTGRTLGYQSPVYLQIEQALIPSRVLAEQEEPAQ